MALTRPNIYNLNTNVEFFSESVTVLNSGLGGNANVDIGLIYNRNNGITSNAASYWNETSKSFVFALTNSAGLTAANIVPTNYANVTVGNLIANALLYANGASILSSLGYGNVQMLSNLAAPNNPITIGSSLTVNGTTATLPTTNVVSSGQNLLYQSASITTTPWSDQNVTITLSQSDAFGTTTAANVTPTVTNAGHGISQNVSTAQVALGTSYLISFYAKANGYSGMGLGVNPGVNANFDLTGANSPVSAYPFSNPTQTAVGNGWYKCTAVLNTVTPAVVVYISISQTFVSSPSNFTPFTFAGNGSSGIFISTIQLSAGVTPVPYVTTTASLVTGYPALQFAASGNIQQDSGGNLVIQPSGAGVTSIIGNLTATSVQSGAGTVTVPAFTQTGTGNIGLYFPTGNVALAYNGANVLFATTALNSVNYLQITGNTSGNTVSIASQGTDVNIDLALAAKGIGNVNVLSPVIVNNTLDWSYGSAPGNMSFYSRGGGFFTKSLGVGLQVLTTTENNPAYLLNTPSPGWGAIGNWYPNGVPGGTWALGYSGGTTWNGQVLTWSANNVATITSTSVLTTGGQYWNGGTGNIQANGSISVAGATVSQGIYVQGNNNLLLYGQTLLAANWPAIGNVAIANNTVSTQDPTGNYTAANIYTTGTGVGYVYQNTNKDPTTAGYEVSQPYTFSVYAKAGSLTSITLYPQTVSVGGGAQVQFNISTGVATVISTNPSLINYNMISVGLGWYRCVVTMLAYGGGSGYFQINTPNATSAGQYLYLWGAQQELGYQASPFTATTTSIATQYNNLSVPYGNINLNSAIQNTYGGNVDITANALVLSSGGPLSGTITTLTQIATGNLYTSAPTVTFSAPAVVGGITATANANLGVVYVGSIQSAGNFYTPGQVLTMVGNASAFTNATFVVTSVGNTLGGTGNVTSIALVTAGSYNIANLNPVSFTVASGAGTGLLANVYYGVNAPVITNPGSGYIEQPTVIFSGGGTGAAAYATIGSPTAIVSTGANLSIVLPQGEVVKFVTSPSIAGVAYGNINGNIGQYANTALTATALTGNAIAAGGMGVVGNIYGTSRIGFTNVGNSSSAAYTVYNSVYNSVDLIFGA